MGVISTISGKCKRCYTCIRSCPVKALSVEKGEARVIDELCVNCGTCFRVCTQKAKEIENPMPAILDAISNRRSRVTALLAPSFPASFPDVNPKKLIGALRALGFSRVIEVAFGAELVGREAGRLMDDSRHPKPIIASPCPVVVSLIERHFPGVIPFLAPTVSPLVALGRYLREIDEDREILVFIGPCVAKKEEIRDQEVAGAIDHTVTFRELKEAFRDRGIDPATAAPSPADPPAPGQARVFPLMGGILKTAGIGTDILDPRIAIIEGRDEVMEFLENFETHPPEQTFIDILFCRGCIDGVDIDSPIPYLERQRKVARFVNESRHLNPSALPEIDLCRSFRNLKMDLTTPSEEWIREILNEMGKTSIADELNCGACGYPSCRSKATAVFHGFAEPEMCLPQIIGQLEESIGELEKSHDDLKRTQAELVQSEKLASLGQLSAGVAHELNNPLGGILLFSNIILKTLRKESSEIPHEMEMIVREATRCRNIVKGLLDFARQSRLQKATTDVNGLLAEVVQVEKASSGGKISFMEEYDCEWPDCQADAAQLRQVFANLVRNSVEAVMERSEGSKCMAADGPDGGVCRISTAYDPFLGQGRITVEDNGIGIPEENLPKLFTPFFTTKAAGKGTGLGLAISYGIIKMHRGSIQVSSSPGKGTSMTMIMPVEKNGRLRTAG